MSDLNGIHERFSRGDHVTDAELMSYYIYIRGLSIMVSKCPAITGGGLISYLNLRTSQLWDLVHYRGIKIPD